MAKVYIGIGSNLGEREDNCLRAIGLLGENGINVSKKSSLYETEPWGMKEQPRFINMAVEAETELAAGELQKSLKSIESHMGRDKSAPTWGPRIIDLDILLYDSLVIDGPDLKIPHPLMHEREFVLRPLSEIAPDAVHPVLGKTIKELQKDLC